uniref:Uncharacterized protein n=1 Tax=Panagrolaimus sp. PS1159 TaxID=55785 RepID=A0AC35FS58_9BILA
MASKTIILCCIFMLLTQEMNADIFYKDKTTNVQPASLNEGVNTISPVNPQPTRAYRTKTILKGAAVVAAVGVAAAAGAYAIFNRAKDSDNHQEDYS